MPIGGASGAVRLDDLPGDEGVPSPVDLVDLVRPGDAGDPVDLVRPGDAEPRSGDLGPDDGPGRRGDPAALARAVARSRPVSLAREHRLPVLPALEGLLPDAGLARGTTVAVTGTSLALALVAGPSQAGSWVALVGAPWVGLGAVAGLGLALERVVVVAEPEPAAWATVAAALVGAFDVVVVAEPERVRAADARRLAARARERGTVVVVVRPSGPAAAVPGRVDRSGRDGLEVDLRLAGTTTGWEGLGAGHGHLRARRVRVEATGRRRAARPRTADLWLPGPDGTVSVVADPAVRRDEEGRSGTGDPATALRLVEPSGHRRAG